MAKKIEVVLELNTRDFNRKLKTATNQLRGFERSATTSARGLNSLSASLAPLLAATGGAALLSKRFGSVVSSSKTLNVATSENSEVFDQFFEEIDTGGKKMQETTRQSNRLTGGIKNLGGSFFKSIGSIGAMIIKFVALSVAIGAVISTFRALQSAVQQAAAFEDVQITLQNITGSAEAGAFALQMITKVAEDLPFAFDQLARSAPVLATVSGTIGELEENMLLAADIAGNFGIPFETAASSLQRAFSAGAGAADVFRERGVLAAAGFEAGVSYSVDETIAKIKEFGTTIEGSAQTLNTTFTGATSQAGDALTLFNAEVGKAASPFFKAFLLELVEIFRDNKDEAFELAGQIGTNLVNGFQSAVIGGAYLLDVLEAIKNGFVTVITLGGLLDGAFEAIGDGLEYLGIKIGQGLDAIIDFDKAEAAKKFFEDVKFSAEEIKAAGDAVEEGAKDIDKSFKIILGGGQDATEGIGSVKDALTIFRDELSRSKGTVEEYNALILKLEELYKTGAIGLEEYIRLKRELDDVFAQNEGLNSFLDTLGTAQVSLSEDLARAFLEGKSAAESFKNFFKTIITQIIADIIRLRIIQPILGSLFGAFGMPISFGTGGNIIPRFAKGGRIMANQPAVVGEEGMELFIPSSSGTIIPNNKLGGGTQQVTYNINAVDTQSFQQALARDPEFLFAVTQQGAKSLPRS